MASYKVCVALATIFVSAQAAFNRDLFDSFPRNDYSWSQDDHLDSASSEHSASYSPFSALKKRQPDYASSREWSSPIKKEPREDKNFKKAISPFYTITEKDSANYKDIVLKSGVPYCQESKSKRSSRGQNAKDSLICYKCRNPKNGATYEECSYVSQPLADSSNIGKVLAAPSGFRIRRSNSDEAMSDFKARVYRNPNNPYRFNEKIFSDESQDVPAKYKTKDEECEKVVKDSMVCMVCRDKKSNGKYEQCSYVSQPKEKKYAFTKTSSYKNPERKGEEDDEDVSRSDKEYSETKPVRETSHSEKEPEKLDEEASEPNCKKVEKDSKTCTICRDPKTGSKSEKCSYAYQPDDKVYKYTKSRSFGNEEAESPSKEAPVKGSYTSREPEDYSKDYSVPESFYAKSGPSYYQEEEPSARYQTAASKDSESYFSDYEKSKSESERIAKNMEPSNCKEVQKDSMSCKVCKDPKSGSVSEQCSYKSRPDEKKFAYTKSKSFGSPTTSDNSEDRSTEGSEKKESRQPLLRDHAYEFTTERPYSSDSAAKRDYREFPSSSESKPEVKTEPTTSSPHEPRFYEAYKKKEEIQKFLQDFQKEDRSKCKKMMKDKMTCYECVDDKGFRQEECAFTTADDAAAEKTERKESEEDEEPSKKIPRSPIIEKRMDVSLDSLASAVEDVEVRREKPDENRSEEETKGVDAYAYVAETRPVFDKVLGFTLPAYMLDTTEYEREFDKSVAAGRI
nr:cylicin-1 [Nomia melanderi]